MFVDLLLMWVIGLVIGLLVVNLMLVLLFLLFIFDEFSFIKFFVVVLGSVMLGFIGINVVDIYGCGFLWLINFNSLDVVLIVEGIFKFFVIKILDISCIIDGRIENLLEIGFLEG